MAVPKLPSFGLLSHRSDPTTIRPKTHLSAQIALAIILKAVRRGGKAGSANGHPRRETFRDGIEVSASHAMHGRASVVEYCSDIEIVSHDKEVI
jgi:hypothetical protein